MTARIQASFSPLWVCLQAAAGLWCEDTNLPGAAPFHGVPQRRQRSKPEPGPQWHGLQCQAPAPSFLPRHAVLWASCSRVCPRACGGSPVGTLCLRVLTQPAPSPARLSLQHTTSLSRSPLPVRAAWPPCSSQGTALSCAPSGLAVSSYITSHHLL